MRLYSMPSSGNSYKVRLLLAMLARDCDMIDVEYGSDALAAALREDRLPFGKAPVLVTDTGRAIAESNAILCFLGEGTRFWPADPADRAEMLGWMFWEQNQHEGVIAVRAALACYPHRAAEATPARMSALLEAGHGLLRLMERHLDGRDWLVGAGPSLADLCLYAYTHSAESRGGFDLGPYPALRGWLDRVAGLPGHVGLDG